MSLIGDGALLDLKEFSFRKLVDLYKAILLEEEVQHVQLLNEQVDIWTGISSALDELIKRREDQDAENR